LVCPMLLADDGACRYRGFGEARDQRTGFD
jgi:hypothetical protein